MNQTSQRTAAALTYAGILPILFLGAAVLMSFTGYDYNFALRSYAVVIISFLCGIHWAAHLFCPHQCPRNLLFTSNIIALIACASLVVTTLKIGYVVQSLCFVVLLLLDHGLSKQHIIPLWYFHLRRTATLAVVALLMSVVFFS